MPEVSSEPRDGRLSSSSSNSTQTDAMRTLHRRPRSAPKTNGSNSHNPQTLASPFQFWSRKDRVAQPVEQGQSNTAATDATYFTRRESDDAAYVDSVSNHLGKLTPPTRPGSGPSSSRMDWPDPSLEEGESQREQPPITREEYLSLPLAIQRKYFSALERLQFAQTCDEVDRIYTHYDLKSQNHGHRKHRPAHSSPETLAAIPDRQGGLRESHAAAEPDSSWLISLQERLNNADLTRDEQVNLIKHLRASVLLEAAKEAFTASGRLPDRNAAPTPEIDHSTATLSSRRGSLESMTSALTSAMEHQLEFQSSDPMRQSLYDSFRWLDEDEDLDLGLDGDDYHANLREHVAPQATRKRRPSFRRHLSISKLSFGRPSMSASRPGSKDTPASPDLERPPRSVNSQRRLSRTLSIMSPSRHFLTEAAPVMDPAAAHYQDPEARQKLRAYLASPTKFDEAVQYGFPATDSTQRPATSDTKGYTLPPHSHLVDGSGNMRSFLDFDGDEEEVSVHDDASSLSEPDSPRTPHIGGGLTPPPGHHRPTRSPTDPLSQTSGVPRPAVAHKPMSSDSTTKHPTSSREMTLRMTLTRPDLRADEEQMYGRQPKTAAYMNQTRRKSHSLPPRSEPATVTGQTRAVCWSEGRSQKTETDKMPAGLDHWSTDSAPGDKGAMKRFWNKVRRA